MYLLEFQIERLGNKIQERHCESKKFESHQSRILYAYVYIKKIFFDAFYHLQYTVYKNNKIA